MEEKLLARFEVENRTFEVSGSYEINKDIDINKDMYHYPEFFDLTAREVVNGKGTDFEPSGHTWAGRKYDVEDMISTFLSSLIKNSDEYKSFYLDAGLQEMVGEYTKDVVLSLKGKEIPRRILSVDMFNLYELLFVTNEYIYYNHDELILMLTSDTHEVVSDNYFAEVGLFDSFDNVLARTETLIWGEIPKEYMEE